MNAPKYGITTNMPASMPMAKPESKPTKEAEAEAEKNKNAKDKKSVIDEVLASRIPNPAKDAQLAKALELVKSPDAYKTALGKGLDKAKLDAAKKDKDKAKADE